MKKTKIEWNAYWSFFGEVVTDEDNIKISARVLHFEEALGLWDEKELHDWTVDAWSEMESICDTCDERESFDCKDCNALSDYSSYCLMCGKGKSECPGCGKPIGNHGTPNGYCCFTCAMGGSES